MVVRVAQQATLSACTACVVATDDVQILEICQQYAVRAILTRPDHPSGSDRLAEACEQLAIPDEAIVVNVQGDEPLIPPDLIQAVAHLLHECPDCVMATAAHTLELLDEFHNPNVVKLVTDAQHRALYFSRAPIPWWRDRPSTDANSNAIGLPPEDAPLRHIGIYAYRASFLRQFPTLQASPLERIESLEQLRVLWHGHRIAVHRCDQAPPGGVDTPEDLERVRAMLQKEKTGATGLSK
jgi:3-deoxy-manno-octulosonate cytidylyltransferase (CMP-KDO synthetase)